MADDRPIGDLGDGEPGAVVLPRVAADEPAAVLLVELGSRRVVYANSLAEQLAPAVVLPAGVDAWSDAAGLRDADGAELSDTDHPLSRLAGGTPRTGPGGVGAPRLATPRGSASRSGSSGCRWPRRRASATARSS